jgi:hypothetical protein
MQSIFLFEWQKFGSTGKEIPYKPAGTDARFLTTLSSNLLNVSTNDGAGAVKWLQNQTTYRL